MYFNYVFVLLRIHLNCIIVYYHLATLKYLDTVPIISHLTLEQLLTVYKKQQVVELSK